MTASSAPSLADFAPEPTTCGTCLLPADLRGELEAARNADPKRFTYVVISRWLGACGHKVHPDALRRHFNQGHQRG